MCSHQGPTQELIQKLQDRMYSSALAYCYLHREGDSLINTLTLIRPVYADYPLPERETLDYGEFVLLKRKISIKELIDIVSQLKKDGPTDVKIGDMNIRVNASYLRYCDRYDSGVGWINIGWGFEMYPYYAQCGRESKALVSVGLPLYTDSRSVRREFIGIDPDHYSDAHGIIVCLPNYEARIREINVSTATLRVSIDTKTATAADIIGKLSYAQDKKTVKKDITFSDDGSSNIIELEFEPEYFHVVLLSKKNGAFLDERRFGFGWDLPVGVKIDIPDYKLLELIENGENQTVEFKEQMCSDHNLVETVVAFANRRGALLFLE